ncbi:MAG TPA: DUF1028 domain-containing protein [Gemmatimonadaceae bacterium]|jgi:uncharacterized Ntn-hydrolase superfamily protein
MRVVITSVLSALLVPLTTSLAQQSHPMDRLDMTTWSVIAADAKTGDVGIAMASCVANTLADGLAALVPGKGVAATQAAFDIDNRNRVFNALKEGASADEVIRRISDPATDPKLGSRQYGVVTISGGVAHTAGFTGKPMLDGDTTGGTHWASVHGDASRGVSVEGNTLASKQVIENALAAFEWDDPTGFNQLSDRLIRAVEAGSAAGGDVRCNNATTRQTAATAMILVARGTDQPYAAEKIGMSDQGTPNAPWLAISVTVEKGGDNPLLELRKRYDAWRRGAKP